MKNVLAHCSRYLGTRNAGLLALALLFSLLALNAWRSASQHDTLPGFGTQQAQQLARAAALHQQARLQQAQQMLQVLAGITPLRQSRPAACNAFLARQLERFPQYDNLAFVDTQGSVRCSAKPLPDRIALPVMAAQALPHVFAVRKNVALALPHVAPDGRIQGAVIALLPMADFFSPHDSILASVNTDRLPEAGPVIPAVASPEAAWRMHWGTWLLALGLAVLAWGISLPHLRHAVMRLIQRLVPGRPPRPVAKPYGDTQLLRSAYAELKGAFAKKEQRVRQLVHLDELSQRLQSCASSTELTDIVARCAQALFPGCHGALYLRVEAGRHGLALAWGGSTLAQSVQTLDCHALHNGTPYVSHGASARACAHVKAEMAYVCLPLQSSSGALGLLYLAHASFQSFGATERTPPWAATAIAERTTIALQALGRQEQLQRRATRDALTGLFNRGFMEEALAIELRRALRRGASVGVMLLDVDHFKRYNDTHGHAAGDAVLRGIGGLMQRTVREGDMPCRYGGEEFVVILPGADLATTQQRAEALRASIEQWQPEIDGAPASVTASIGVACYPRHGMTLQAILKRADLALYAAKHAGRNRVYTADAYKTEQEAVPA